ncbi:MAG: T9SS type A sorting domain-containing protein [Bacteroidia bacterium]|nr:T9SS type A sorting domain-containing protein [Bacteroidia bacterium]
MKKRFAVLIGLLSLLLIGKVRAQGQVYLQVVNGNLGGVLIDSSFTDSIILAPSASSSLQITFANVGNEVFTGDIGLGVRVSNDTLQNQLVNYGNTVTAQQLAPGLSSSFSFPDFGLPNTDLQLRIGGNVVVVWPVAVNSASSIVAVDSLKFKIHVGDTANAAFYHEFQTNYVVYPNPASDRLYIALDSGTREETIEKVQVLGLDGKLEMEKQGFDGSIDLMGLSPGMHLVRVIEKNKGFYTFRIFLE